MDTANITIPQEIIDKWQGIVNLIAGIVEVPAALIMKIEPPEITVFISSQSESNPYTRGERTSLDIGLYCETVMRTRKQLLVPDALEDEEWKDNPDTKLGMVSYLGLPLLWPNQDVFGTICILDYKKNAYNELYQNLMMQFRDVIQADLKYLFNIAERREEEERIKNDLKRSVEEERELLDKAEKSRRTLLTILEDRKRAEKELRASEKRYRTLFEESRDAICITTREGRVVDANQSALNLFGYVREEIVGLEVRNVYAHPIDREVFQKEIEQKGSVRDYEVKFRKKDGVEISCLVTSAVQRAEDGSILGYQSIIRDITEQKRVQEEILHRNRQLEILSLASQKVNTTLDIPVILRTLVASATELVGATSGTAGLMVKGKMVFTEYYNRGSFSHVNYTFELGYGVPGYIMETMEPYISNDTERDPFVISEIQKALGFYNLINVPIISRNGELLGCFEIHNTKDRHPFGESDVALLQGLSASVAVAIENARMLNERKRAEELLNQSLEQWQNTFDAIEDMVAIIGKDYRVERVNKAMYKTFAGTKVVGARCYELFHGTKNPISSCPVHKTFRTGEVNHAEIYERHLGGRWFDIFAYPIKDGNGMLRQVVHIVRDITERKQAEKALQESETRLRLLIDQMPAILWRTDAELRFTSSLGTGLRALGLRPNQVVGMTLFDYFETDDPEFLPIAAHRRSLKGEPATFELKWKERTFSSYVGPLRDESGNIVGTIGVALDITERERVEHRIQALLRLHENTLSTMPSQFLVLDADMNIIMVNQQFLDTCDVRYSDVIGNNIADVISTSLLTEQSLLRRIRAVADSGGQDELLGVKHSSPNHPDKYLNIRIRGIIPTKEGEERRALLIIDDITEQRILEEQLRQSQKMEAIGRLAGGVAHDFNNILTGIIGYTQLAINGIQGKYPMLENLTQIRELANRAANLTRQLLAFSRRQTLEPIAFNINDLVGNISKMLQRLIGEDIDLKFVPASDIGTVRADPGQIEQVLMNLAVNARDAMPKGGKLTIETANVVLDKEYANRHIAVIPGPYVMIAVTDTGHGMDEETRERIFEPFFTTKEIGKGTGLGLSTVYGIVKQHGGNIWAYSEQGKGTTFKIYLPRVDEDVQELTTRVKESVGQLGSETILIVEDENAVRAIMQRALEKQGYTIIAASCPEEAEEVFAQHGDEISLLLTDVVMPKTNGHELYKKLAIRRPSLKVLYVSGYTENTILHHGVPDPDAPFMQKPFTPSALAQKVREVLDR